ncbi:MAG: RNA polymerase subunit sigma-24 [Pseudonocardiales bacterium]|nr:MAG: RNA polymerase subunit sigma-24 [Pseudonocardiales bacterium]
MSATPGVPSAELRLRRLFEQHSAAVLRYAMRHADAASAHDVVSDVFLVAWRRIREIPETPLPWLLVVARNSIKNRNRSSSRRQRLSAELAALDRAAATAAATEDIAVERASMLDALAELTAEQREALLLVAWDGLAAADAAAVVGCSRAAFEVRVHRARARLRKALAADSDSPAPHAAARTPKEALL